MFDLVNDRSRVDLDLGTYKEAKAWQGQRGWKVTTFEPLRVLRPDEIAIERITVHAQLGAWNSGLIWY